MTALSPVERGDALVSSDRDGATHPAVTLRQAASSPPEDVLAALGATAAGLTNAQARTRLDISGPNEITRRRESLPAVVVRQLRNPLLVLLFATALLSSVAGERTNALIVLIILAASVTLGTVNDYRATSAAAALAVNARRRAMVRRDGQWHPIDVRELVPGDLVQLVAGVVVPADLRLLHCDSLACDESALTGESLDVDKAVDAVPSTAPLAELRSVALSGTVVRTGHGTGVVVATGEQAQIGRIAAGLHDRPPRTAFESGLTQFSRLLAGIALIVSVAVFAINLLLHRGLLDALLFATAIAVGITPQLLPAVVGTSLANGIRSLSRRKVLVKRLVAIEDLGDITMLVTDKTGTLTEGTYTLDAAINADGRADPSVATLGLLCTTLEHSDDGTVNGDALEVALFNAVPTANEILQGRRTLAVLPFDHARRRSSVLIQDGDDLRLVTKGAPEQVLALCNDVTDRQRRAVQTALDGGGRVIAVATRLLEVQPETALSVAAERDLSLAGALVFDDPPKAGVIEALGQLDQLGVRVLVASGDSIPAAIRLAAMVGLTGAVLSGAQLEALDDQALTAALDTTDVLARVTPEQKARVVRLLQQRGDAVGFLGDGVNDALALHRADVGISVDHAVDVARDAADVVLLDKSLGVVADGIAEGRRIFANTIKYVLMGTSSNFGNILSAAAASALLPFLPMLPSQLLLNNLLYDSGQLTIPTDNVDADQLQRPAQWNLGIIRRFMLTFGPLSSLFDFVTFGVLLGAFHASPQLFRSGWFVESLVTQTAVVLAVRTHRTPFWRSRPSRPLILSIAAVIIVGALLPASPVAGKLGFVAPSLPLYLAIAGLSIVYVELIDRTKAAVFAAAGRHDGQDFSRPTEVGRAPQRGASNTPSAERRP